MKQNVCLLAMDWDVRRAAFRDGIRRGSYVLLLFVFGVLLRGIRGNGGGLSEVLIRDRQLGARVSR
jgi:hypothetical protein